MCSARSSEAGNSRGVARLSAPVQLLRELDRAMRQKVRAREHERASTGDSVLSAVVDEGDLARPASLEIALDQVVRGVVVGGTTTDGGLTEWSAVLSDGK